MHYVQHHALAMLKFQPRDTHVMYELDNDIETPFSCHTAKATLSINLSWVAGTCTIQLNAM